MSNIQKALQIIDEAYGLIEPNDTVISITEQGLIKAIAKALDANLKEWEE